MALKQKIRFEVEWCVNIPRDENGDGDFDRADYRFRHFPTMGLAAAFARNLIRQRADAFGAVAIRQQYLHAEGRREEWENVDRWECSDAEGEPAHVGMNCY